MKKPEMNLWGVMIANLVSRYLARDRKRAEYIVAQTFPGHRIGRIRKDKGTTKTNKAKLEAYAKWHGEQKKEA